MYVCCFFVVLIFSFCLGFFLGRCCSGWICFLGYSWVWVFWWLVFCVGVLLLFGGWLGLELFVIVLGCWDCCLLVVGIDVFFFLLMCFCCDGEILGWGRLFVVFCYFRCVLGLLSCCWVDVFVWWLVLCWDCVGCVLGYFWVGWWLVVGVWLG